MSSGEYYDKRFPEGNIPREWQEIEAAVERLEDAGWTVEPYLISGFRKKVTEPWFEMSKPISRDTGIPEMKRFILSGLKHIEKWPHDWQMTIETDIENAWDLEQISNATYFIRLGYIGTRFEPDIVRFVKFTNHLAEAFSPKRSWRERWLGRLGLSASS